MQLSFSSVPTDPTNAIASGAAQPAGAGVGDASGSATPFGFAQVLAGVAPGASPGQGAKSASAGNVLSPGASNPALLNAVLPAAAGVGGVMVGMGVTTDVATPGADAIAAAGAGVAKPSLGGASAPTAPRATSKKALAEMGDLQALAVTATLLPAQVPPPPAQPATTDVGTGNAKVSGATGNVLDLGEGPRATGVGVSVLGGPMARLTTGPGSVTQPAAAPIPTAKPGASTGPVFHAPDSAAPATDVDRAASVLPKTAAAESKIPLAGMPTAQAATTSAGQGPEAAQTDHLQSGAMGLPSDTRAIADTNVARAIMPEKIAANVAPQMTGVQSPIESGTKSTLTTKPKGVAQAEATFGIGVAKHDATMPAGSTFARSPVSEPPPVAASPSMTDVRSSTNSVPPPVVLTSSAHRAVEAVLDATDRFAARDQHSVNLQFSVGGTDLNVRVELRSGEVHTTFRTDSPELRAALSSEWNAMTSQQNGDRSARLAAPVFSGNDQAGTSTSFSGDGASRQRDPQARQAAPQNSGFAGSRRDPAASSSSSNSNSPMTRSVAVNSVHLHTLA